MADVIDFFGLQGLRIALYSQHVNSAEPTEFKLPDYNLNEVQTDGDNPYVGQLNNPVLSPLVIPDGTFQLNDRSTVDYQGINLKTVVIDVSLSKQIVKTVIQGRPGTIKEYITDDDYQINIKGVLTGTEDEIKDLRRRLINIASIPSDVPISCDFLQEFGIYSMVMENVKFPTKQGQGSGFQAFEINGVSDTPNELQPND